jgi:hypothetical protein
LMLICIPSGSKSFCVSSFSIFFALCSLRLSRFERLAAAENEMRKTQTSALDSSLASQHRYETSHRSARLFEYAATAFTLL